MTLILGVNLSDRVYLASDTRVTYETKGTYQDNLQKVALFNNGEFAVAVAGNVHFAKYLVNELKKAPFVFRGIEVVEKRIYHWCRAKVDKYLQDNKKFPKACLLFVGIEKNKKNLIKRKKYQEVMKRFRGSMSESRFSMRNILFNALLSNTGDDLILSTPKNIVFSVLIDTQNNIYRKENASWGEYLIYGPKEFKRELLPANVFEELEFGNNAGRFRRDALRLVALIKGQEKSQKLESVGGSIIPFMINNQGFQVFANLPIWSSDIKENKNKKESELRIKDDKLYSVDENGNLIPLVSFLDFEVNKNDSLNF